MRYHRTNGMMLAAALAMAAPLAMGACDDEDITDPGDGTAQVSVYLTDAPGDVEAVWVEILELYLQGGEEGPVHLLGESTDLVLLTDLVGTTQLLAADVEVDPAVYGQIRMVVGDAILVSSDGTVYTKGDPEIPAEFEDAEMGELMCPSCSQSGLKITIPNDEVPVDAGALAFIVDFDVAESFGHRAGNSGRWNMHPVIHGTIVVDADGDGSLSDELDSVSDIRGTVVLGASAAIPECPAGTPRSIEDFIPTATSTSLVGPDGPIVRTGVVAADGAFTIAFLAPSTYTLGYVGTLELGDDDLVFTASVDPAQAVVADTDVEGVTYTIESAQCVGG